jgi:hypothetical protein
MKRLFALILAMVCLLLCSCGANEEPYLTAPTTQPTTSTNPTTQPTTEPVEDPTKPTEPPVVDPIGFPHPITGQWLEQEDPYLVRPYAVVMDNDEKSSTPHWGCSAADMIWELPHEGGTTRCVGIFTDFTGVDKLGPNRSVRPYILSTAMSFNAILVHAGGSPQGYQMLKDTKWNNMDGVQGPGAGDYYHRDRDRLNAGVASWHTMYTTAEEVIEYTAKRGYKTQLDEQANYGMIFAEDATPNGIDANTVTITFRNGGRTTIMHYDAEKGGYSREQFGQVYADGNDGTVPYFENVLVLATSVRTIDDYGRLSVTLVGEGSGWFASGGKMIPIKWSRASETSPYAYTLEDGTPLTFGAGKTFAAVIYNNGTVKGE